jgi:PAS domain-containing protein
LKLSTRRVPARVLLALGLLTLGAAAVMGAAFQYGSARRRVLLAEWQQERAAAFDRLLALRREAGEAVTRDNGVWDDLARAVRRRDRAWIGRNAAAHRSYPRADALWVYDVSGELLFVHDRLAGERMPALPPEVVAAVPSRAGSHHFFLAWEGTVLEMHVAHVQTLADNQAGPDVGVVGHLFVGSEWSAERLAELSSLAEARLGLHPPGAPVPGDEGAAFVATRDLPGWDGRPVARLHAVWESSALMRFWEERRRRFAFYGLTTAGLIGLVAAFLLGFVVRPLRRLSRALAQEDGPALAALGSDPSEFGDLARHAARLLEETRALRAQATAREGSQEAQARLRAAIEAAASEWHSTFDTLDCAVVLLDPARRIARVNRHVRETVGAEYRELLGRPVSSLGAGEPWREMAHLAAAPGRAASLVRDEKDRTWLVAVHGSSGPTGTAPGRLLVTASDVTGLGPLR